MQLQRGRFWFRMVKLGIGLLPDEHLRQQAIRLSQLIREYFEGPLGYKTSYVLSEDGPHPHITLFQGHFRSARQVESAAHDLAQEISKPIVMKNRGLSNWSTNFIFYEFQQDGYDYYGRLRPLHGKAVRALENLVNKSAAPIASKQNLTHLTKEELASIKKYGYPFIRRAFIPHITLTRIIKPSSYTDPMLPHKVIASVFESVRFSDYLSPGIIPWSNAKTAATKLIVYDVGIDGACERIRKSWPLPQPKRRLV